jgi:hypothetical protein
MSIQNEREKPMYEYGEELNQLVERARDGEAEAEAQLKRALEPQLQRIVRRTVRAGADNTPLNRRILADAGSARWSSTGERRIGQTASRLCASLVERLTEVRPARQLMKETVLA